MSKVSDSSNARRIRPSAIRVGGYAVGLQLRAAPIATLSALGLNMLVGSTPALSALILRRLLDDLTGHVHGSWTPTQLAVALASVTAISAAISSIAQYPAEMANQRLGVLANSVLYRRIACFRSLRPFEDPSFHDRLALAQDAAQEAGHVVTPVVQGGVTSVMIIATFTGVLLNVWPPMVILLFVAAAPIVFVRNAQTKHLIRATNALAPTYRRGVFFRYLFTDARAAKEMRLFGFAPFVHDRMVNALRTTAERMVAIQLQQAVAQVAFALTSAAVMAIGLVVVVDGVQQKRFTIGDIAVFTAAVSGVQGALAGLTSQIMQARRSLGRFRNFVELIDEPEDLSDGDREPPKLRTGLELENVWFRYSDESPWVLAGVNLFIPAGATVGIVGLNGAGKTTLLKLLSRLYDPQDGRVIWDGVDLRDMKLVELRRKVSGVFQDFGSYDLTAAENIGIAQVERIQEQSAIEHAAQRAGIHDVVSALQNGYRTLLSRTFRDESDVAGSTLSTGEWQRLALARSLFRDDAELWLLDEPSASLDALAERRIYEAFKDQPRKATTVIVSHHMNVIADADLIFVLSGSVVAEQGSHSELLARGGIYANLFYTQATVYQSERLANV